ncbi:quinohemoprotein amine dehydrogenase subunit beta [Thauera linaloolentis]|uniref:Quinohemoprotein amine dehydrogeasesubunit beta n=1 Tax=Thauera linaloolentis (strain DSM 12138 / JCM 21573 / CCUG 41526 / CIP 105981 / IAM 15112 / NBRC 102519 / 47Lol) TaxID=1123367 RepID=N6XYN1_THAL4|nr:quinohemoprotein amine dehydrogenase subunit beta [Thauera linaloolentis]ENO84365.1 quinohemoprotein amine dehydrogeasesubunit beta [Thauera linaloolentis 47Lol = DSM 12138]MCM8566873.1 quinohemoprotein amine dehydrogenase subunit beta [Thauera linaloolentis]
MKKTTIGGALCRSLALAACVAGGATPAAAANESLALKTGSEYLMVANYPNNLNVVDVAAASVYKTCTLPDAFGPGLTQISPDRRTAYILNNRFGTIYGVELDTCKLTFRAEMSLADNERAKSIASFTVSADGKELYAVQNPTTINRDHYRVGEPRFAVYDTGAGLNARPVRVFPAPRQSTIMQAAPDGTLYLAGQNLYTVDVKTGDMKVKLPIRDWNRSTHAPLDVLYVWPVQTPQRDFTILYTTAAYQDGTQDMATAEFQYGYLNVNLKTGEAEAREFGPLTEIYFTGLRSPKDRNVIYGLLHRLAKYDIAQQKLVHAVELDHTYYTLLTNQDGSRLYLTGTFNDIAIYDADSLTKLGNVQLPGGDMSLGTGQVFVR